MIFNSNEFKIKQPISKGLLAAIVSCAVSLCGLGYFAIAAGTAEDKSAELQKRLTNAEESLKLKVEELASTEKALNEKIDQVKADSSSEITALDDKLAAFAKQAAACEKLRTRIGR
jgi:uncharacterized protein YlxW (UPF0749 family)